MLIAVLNSKGGVGKSTIAVHTTVWLREQGVNVALLDADEQGSSAAWAPDAAPGLPVFRYTTAHEILEGAPQLRKWYEAIVADGPAALNAEIASLATVADLVVLPLLPSMLDIAATYRTARAVYKLRFQPGRNGRPRALTVLNRAVSRTRLARLAVTAIQQYGFPVSPVVLESRLAYVEACQRSSVVWRLGKRAAAAAAEMNRVCEIMLKQIPDQPVAARILKQRQRKQRTTILAQRCADAQGVLVNRESVPVALPSHPSAASATPHRAGDANTPAAQNVGSPQTG